MPRADARTLDRLRRLVDTSTSFICRARARRFRTPRVVVPRHAARVAGPSEACTHGRTRENDDDAGPPWMVASHTRPARAVPASINTRQAPPAHTQHPRPGISAPLTLPVCLPTPAVPRTLHHVAVRPPHLPARSTPPREAPSRAELQVRVRARGAPPQIHDRPDLRYGQTGTAPRRPAPFPPPRARRMRPQAQHLIFNAAAPRTPELIVRAHVAEFVVRGPRGSPCLMRVGKDAGAPAVRSPATPWRSLMTRGVVPDLVEAISGVDAPRYRGRVLGAV